MGIHYHYYHTYKSSRFSVISGTALCPFQVILEGGTFILHLYFVMLGQFTCTPYSFEITNTGLILDWAVGSFNLKLVSW